LPACSAWPRPVAAAPDLFVSPSLQEKRRQASLGGVFNCRKVTSIGPAMKKRGDQSLIASFIIV
jgi:hypothetical protein